MGVLVRKASAWQVYQPNNKSAWQVYQPSKQSIKKNWINQCNPSTMYIFMFDSTAPSCDHPCMNGGTCEDGQCACSCKTGLSINQSTNQSISQYVQLNNQWNCSILLPISISPFPWLPHSTLTFIQALIPGQPFPRSTNIPFSDRPFPHMVISFPVTLFPSQNAESVNYATSCFYLKIKALANQIRTKQSHSLISLCTVCTPTRKHKNGDEDNERLACDQCLDPSWTKRRRRSVIDDQRLWNSRKHKRENDYHKAGSERITITRLEQLTCDGLRFWLQTVTQRCAET